MSRKLKESTARIDAWMKEYDAVWTARIHASEYDERERLTARLHELHEEGQGILAELRLVPGDAALITRRNFEFMVRNVQEMDRPPHIVQDICRAIAA
ncbi:MAG: hypothetical protein JSR99_09950 [Proteobacteria bacterium]|nr:hypothetical protein [Pseudomonadota bacterium]